MIPLHALAAAVGVIRVWRDAKGHERIVSDDALAAVLEAFGYPCGSDAAIRASLELRAREDREVPALLTAEVGKPTALLSSSTAEMTAELLLESGRHIPLRLEDGTLGAICVPGYHTLRIAGHEMTLAVAPSRCRSVADLAGAGRRLWGPAIQIPSLRSEYPKPFGDFDDLREAVRLFADAGADAVAISPVHAARPGLGEGYSPYAPSSRQFLNVALLDPEPGLPGREQGDTPIDWAGAMPARLEELLRCFALASTAERDAAVARGAGLGAERQALFDALTLHFAALDPDWRGWPEAYRDPEGAAVRDFARRYPEEVAFHLFAQALADEALGAVQQSARDAGMALGLIADLAIGVDPGGADAWSLRDDMLQDLTIGAPPDPLGPEGQNWGLTTFSPRGLTRSGFRPWIATIRAALRHAGGLRIDHAFGLARLWVVPEGATALQGAYVTYPLDDLLRLIALESHRAGALIVGEDLGTHPPGFAMAAADRGMLGMRVLWFERDCRGGFRGSRQFDADAVAMTGTHDTATVAGWWRGRDIAWNRQLARGGAQEEQESMRMKDRAALWEVIGGEAPQPATDDPAPVVEAALSHIGRTPAALAILPLEDLLALEEQPNLPGTVDEHPNWRRRLRAPLADLLAEPQTARRIAALAEARAA